MRSLSHGRPSGRSSLHMLRTPDHVWPPAAIHGLHWVLHLMVRVRLSTHLAGHRVPLHRPRYRIPVCHPVVSRGPRVSHHHFACHRLQALLQRRLVLVGFKGGRRLVQGRLQPTHKVGQFLLPLLCYVWTPLLKETNDLVYQIPSARNVRLRMPTRRMPLARGGLPGMLLRGDVVRHHRSSVRRNPPPAIWRRRSGLAHHRSAVRRDSASIRRRRSGRVTRRGNLLSVAWGARRGEVWIAGVRHGGPIPDAVHPLLRL